MLAALLTQAELLPLRELLLFGTADEEIVESFDGVDSVELNFLVFESNLWEPKPALLQ